MNRPKISFVIPVYNVGDLLLECLDSIYEQEADCFEIILVNDGSTDSSGDICESYRAKHNNIKVIHKKNGGLSDARNAGLPHCEGDYVWFVDSDDFLPADCLTTLLSHLEDSPNILLFNFREVGEKRSHDILKFNNEQVLLSGKEIVEKYNTYGIQAWTQIYSVDLIRKNNMTFLKGATYEDVIFNLPLYAQVKKIKVISAVCYCYRQREGSIMNSHVRLNNILSLMTICEKMLPIYHAKMLSRTFLLDRFHYYLTLIIQFYYKANLSRKDKKKLYNKLREMKFTIPKRENETSFFGFAKTYGLRFIPRFTFFIYPLVVRIATLKNK